MTKLLIDGDVVAYTASFHARSGNNTEEEAKDKIDTTIKWSLHRTQATSYQVYLTGKGNFRYEVNKTYKAHRPTEKPLLLPFCRNHQQWEWGAVVSQGEEADDLIAMEAARMNYQGCIIASVDKDFLQVPVPMYNWRKDTLTETTPEEAVKFFYKQILMGDSADGVKGCPRIGPKGADNLLHGLWDEATMYSVCVDSYIKAGLTEQDVINNARLLWLRREPDEMWEPPVWTT